MTIIQLLEPILANIMRLYVDNRPNVDQHPPLFRNSRYGSMMIHFQLL